MIPTSSKVTPTIYKSLVSLTWKNVSIKTTENKQLIHNATGIVNPGEMLAIMGSSGAGKTTLLNSLSFQSNNRELIQTGSIKVNNHEIGAKIHNIAAFCQQEDLFMGALTVREHLRFHARLKSVEFVEERIEQIIEEMGLSSCADTKIGTFGRDKTISGGERKRLSFGTHILIQPAIFFADEPTSGLDYYLAQAVVTSLLNIAKKGTTILCTIHQPSSDTFQLFHKLLLLSHGETVYFGNSGSPIVKYFDKVLNSACEQYTNPADHYIKTISVRKKRANELAKIFRETKNYDLIVNDFNNISNIPPVTKVKKKCNVFIQLKMLIWRAMIMTYRDPMISIARVVQSLVVGVILGAIYFRNPPLPYIGLVAGTNFSSPTQSLDIGQIHGALFSMTAVGSMFFVFFVVTLFPLIGPVWRIDYESKLYDVPIIFS